jgi:hypothetical protein
MCGALDCAPSVSSGKQLRDALVIVRSAEKCIVLCDAKDGGRDRVIYIMYDRLP